MASGQLGTVVAFLRRATPIQEVGDPTDGQLLERYVVNRDEAAFAALVHRHAPLVWGVCRRLLAAAHDAEDAFQATFLVLVRRAGSIGKRESVRSWLYGVAYRVAARARSGVARRQSREKPLGDLPRIDPAADVGWRELRPILDEEISRLPEKQRLPIILCHLEGKTHDEAARELGCPRATVATRITRGRERLRRQLLRRGLALSAGMGSMIATTNAGAAAVPSGLSARVIQTATSGENTGLASSLAERIMRTMLWHKLQLAVVVVLATVIFGAGIGWLVGSVFAPGKYASPPKASANEPAPPAPPADALKKQVQAAVTRGVAYLRSQQRNGHWDHNPQFQQSRGGPTSLALLAMLEAGVKPDAEAIKKGLDYLRNVPPQQTYVVSLQTQVFCRADPKSDRTLIQRNVDWLLEARSRSETGELVGWSYAKGPSTRGDNSNTQFAVMALHAANEGGVKIDDKVWQELQELYLRTQTGDGGWSYVASGNAPATVTMTSAGLCGLLLSTKHRTGSADRVAAARDKGLDWLAPHLNLKTRGVMYYQIYGIGRTGRLVGKPIIAAKNGKPAHDWYREGSQLLLQEQGQNGAWQGAAGFDGDPIISTSFALLFLGKGI
jgi:RNA polymerase sigma factor (sigma-70 family)